MGLTLNEAVDLMRGPVGSDITITLHARGHRRSRSTSRSPARRSPSRRCASRLEDGVVVLRLTTFNEQTYPELEEQLKEQVEAAGGMDKVTGFVIDLRNNPGGLLNQAISVVDAFLEFGRDRLDPRPRPARQRALQRDAGRPDRAASRWPS